VAGSGGWTAPVKSLDMVDELAALYEEA